MFIYLFIFIYVLSASERRILFKYGFCDIFLSTFAAKLIDMFEARMQQFDILACLQMPRIFKTDHIITKEIYDDYALVEYKLENHISMDNLLELLDDQTEIILLYHNVPSKDVDFGQSCCAYSNPRYCHMLKFNSHTNGAGLCTSIYVTIYSSLEYMYIALQHEVQLIMTKGKCDYMRSGKGLLADFF